MSVADSVEWTGLLLIKVRLILVVIFLARDSQHVQASDFMMLTAVGTLRAEKGRSTAAARSLATHLVEIADVIHVEHRAVNFFWYAVSGQS